MKNYDFELAEKIIETFCRSTDVDRVSMGMQEDWFWTAEDVYSDGKILPNLKEKVIGGINGSRWATPVIQVDLSNGETHTFNCYTQEGEEVDIFTKMENMNTWVSGCLSKEVAKSRIDMEVKDFNPNS